jgi:organic hydroperoxide reductase OsmC/OhrA
MEVSDPERARTTFAEAKQHCLITNALRAPVDVDARIRPPGIRKAG